MADRPIVLIHGYSDRGSSFKRWRDALAVEGTVLPIHTCNYETLTNEVTIRDIAEGFTRALRVQAGLSNDESFDAIVHSTGMLVLRAWLAADPRRRLPRLRHLVALAPATFGSPLAHKGRSWIGSIFKGRKEFGPDFLEAGDNVLDGLELGGRFTWDLAHADLLGVKPFYSDTPNDTYVFTFCGNRGYEGLKAVANEKGTDGTVRWSGCAMNTRKFTLDLTSNGNGTETRWTIEPVHNARNLPLVLVPGVNHATILSDPPPDLIRLVKSALRVETDEEWLKWLDDADQVHRRAAHGIEPYQQFIVRATDERGDGVLDYNLDLSGAHRNDKARDIEFDLDVHAYSRDNSLRCFHVNLDRLKADDLSRLELRLTASTGTQLVAYNGHGTIPYKPPRGGSNNGGRWQGTLDITPLLTHAETRFFWPHTTTLVELRIDREPVGDRVLRFSNR